MLIIINESNNQGKVLGQISKRNFHHEEFRENKRVGKILSTSIGYLKILTYWKQWSKRNRPIKPISMIIGQRRKCSIQCHQIRRHAYPTNHN